MCVLCREVRFDLQLGGPNGQLGLNSFDEGMEFAFRNLNGSREWIPLMFYSSTNKRSRNNNMVGDRVSDKLIIRGYNVSYINIDTSPHTQLLKICGNDIAQDPEYTTYAHINILSCLLFT